MINCPIKIPILFLCFFFCCNFLFAEEKIEKKSDHKFQLEAGLNFTNYLNGHGFTFNSFKYREPIRQNYYLAVIYTLNNKHSFRFNYQRNMTPSSDLIRNRQIGLVGGWHKCLSAGYGYILNLKDLQFSLNSQLSYRYQSGELVVFDYRQNPNWPEPLLAFIDYNSVGISNGVDVKYFFTRNIGLGAELFYHYYPFENAKLYGSNIEKYRPEFVESYKPNREMLSLNFKLVYRFALDFLKKND